MEGRWAQLTIDAHIAKAIDYSRPVKPFIEEAILKNMALQRDLRYAALYPAINEEGDQLSRTKGWVDSLVTRLKPWVHNEETEAEKQNTLLDKIAYLEELRNSK